MKARFTVNPFEELNLTPGDRTSLQDLANQVIMSNLQMCMKYMNNKLRVDLNHWKPLKGKDNVQVYSERPEGVSAAVAAVNEPTGAGLPMILCVGTKEGKLDDLMYGVTNEDLETMRMKASYVDDFSGAAVLNSVVLPTLEDPFQSLVVKWMELDIPLHSTNLVKNLDYVYLEATGHVTNANGERLAYHLLHSVNFPQTHSLPHRVRGNISIIGFWRQIDSNTMEMYATGVMDPVDTGLVRKLVVPQPTCFYPVESMPTAGKCKSWPSCSSATMKNSRNTALRTRKAYASDAQHRLLTSAAEISARVTGLASCALGL